MSNQTPEIITKYDVMFAVRTGVTIMVQKVTAFEGCDKTPATFKVDKTGDVHITTLSRPVILKGMKKDHVEAAIARGFIMFYEMEGDEDIVRNTLCNYKS